MKKVLLTILAVAVVLTMAVAAFAAGDLNITTRAEVIRSGSVSIDDLTGNGELWFSGGKNGLLAAQFAAGDPSDNQIPLKVSCNVPYSLTAGVTAGLTNGTDTIQVEALLDNLPGVPGVGGPATIAQIHMLSGVVTADLFASPGSYNGNVQVDLIY